MGPSRVHTSWRLLPYYNMKAASTYANIPPLGHYEIPYEADVYVGWQVKTPLDKMPKWKQKVIRFCHWLTGYSTGVETQFVLLDKEVAERIADSIPGGCYQPMPINQVFPVEPVKYKGARFPRSDSKKVREHGNSCLGQLPVVNPAILRQIQEVNNQAHSLLAKSRAALNGTQSKSAVP